MKKYAAFYYFLFLLLIMGTFASMAQNSYGLIICGIGCVGFIILFVYELVFSSSSINESSGSWLQRMELVLVIAIALIFAIRDFSIDGSFFTNILNLLLLGMLWSTLYYALAQSRLPVFQEPSVAWPMACYYAAIVFLVISFLASGALPLVGNILALAGISLVALFVVLTLAMKRKATVESASPWQYVEELRNKSSIVLIAAVLLTGFNLLTSVGVLPPLYRDNVPPGYQVLVEQGVLNGDQTKSKEFESSYDQFIERWEK